VLDADLVVTDRTVIVPDVDLTVVVTGGAVIVLDTDLVVTDGTVIPSDVDLTVVATDGTVIAPDVDLTVVTTGGTVIVLDVEFAVEIIIGVPDLWTVEPEGGEGPQILIIHKNIQSKSVKHPNPGGPRFVPVPS
jgi:hypothetical protein